LADKHVGRVTYSDEAGPVILPVNYAVENQSVLFRTSAASSMALHLRDRTVAFEVDDVDEVPNRAGASSCAERRHSCNQLAGRTITHSQPPGRRDHETF
jgi:nitroimidazol reductase NimA-like FMN-containing flavoprotein (pyridoxamine 5'-phosphate oxidase superfamily)